MSELSGRVAIVTQDAAIGCDPIRLGLTQTQMGHGLGLLHGRLDGRHAAIDHLMGKGHIKFLGSAGVLSQQGLGGKVTARPIMLVQGMNGHPISGRTSGLGQFLPPQVMGAVADADPVYSTEYNRSVLREQNDAACTERINDLPGWSIGHRTTKGRRCINLECGNAQWLCFDRWDQRTPHTQE